MFRIKKLLSLSSLLFAITAYAQPTNHIVVAPKCLSDHLKSSHQILSTLNGLNLLAVNEAGIDELIAAKHAQKKVCGGFMDVTAAWQTFNATSNKDHRAKTFLNEYNRPTSVTNNTSSYEIKYQTQVNQLLEQMNPQNMWNNLNILTNFPDRYSKSENGVQAANWFKSQIETLATQNNRQDVTVSLIQTGDSYIQPSVVAKIGEGEGPGIVIGGHMDTLRACLDLWCTDRGYRPGADDDGSGSVTVLEIARTLLSSGMTFKKPIYFIWYAAEEQGLIGSQYVVKYFKKKHIPVEAVLQLDMTGYVHEKDPTIWLINDYVDANLTNYLASLINTYVKRPVNYTKCGYDCSDHASWYQKGYPSSFPIEAKFGNEDPYLHTSNDKMDHLSLDHMTDFAKLGIAFAVELAEPV